VSLRILPWWTDSAISFIEGFLESFNQSKPLIFEYGGGNSTIYFLQKNLRVITIEHDADWYEKLNKTAEIFVINNDNIDIRLSPRPYHKQIAAITDTVKNHPLSIVVVDGRDRVKCIRYSTAFLYYHNIPHILILDNAERLGSEYREARKIFDSCAYRRRYHFEQANIIASNNYLQSLPDRAGWQAPHRWITSIYFSEHCREYSQLGHDLIANG